MKWRDCLGCEHDPKRIEYDKLSKYIETKRNEIKELREMRDNKLYKNQKQYYVNEINKKTDELKPYIKKRSDIKKTLAKVPMCEERYYRFIKEPKGVIPTILQNLLDARKHTRELIKQNKKEIEKLNPEIDKDKIKDLKLLNNSLDKRQLSYKISCNSTYGIMGVTKGYLPFMAGAMCCTYMGRVNIEIVAKTITEKYGGKLVYGD